MPTLGEELRRRREERGTTLAEISEATRIGTRFLKAIESDNFSVLPGGIYTRNFIRSYAESVGMKEDEAIALYHQQVSSQSGNLPGVTPIQAHSPQAVESRPARAETVTVRHGSSRTSWSTIVIAAGVILIVLIIGISLVQRLNRTPTEAQSPPSAPAPVASNPPEQNQKPESRTPAKPETAKNDTTPAQPETANNDAARGEAPSLSANEPLKVRLEAATGASYIAYWIDDVSKSTGKMLYEGDAIDLPPAQSEVRLNIGDRTTLRILINGREATFPAETQKFSAKVTVSRENIESFFP